MVKSLKIIDKIGLCFLVALLISRAFLFVFEENFDAEIWKSTPKQRYKMVDNIIDSQLILYKTPKEVTQLLGTPSTSYTNNSEVFVYSLGTPPYFFSPSTPQLIVVFHAKKVVAVAKLKTKNISILN